MEMLTGWTGETACALQAALRMSNETFAEHLGIGVRTVAAWHQKPSLRPRPEMQQILDAALARAPESARERFAGLIGMPDPASAPTAMMAESAGEYDNTADAEYRLVADESISTALSRLDHLARWESGTARRQVAAKLARLDKRQLLDRMSQRKRIGRERIAQALGEYYAAAGSGYGRYGAQCGQDAATVTSVLTHPDWLDLGIALTGQDRLAFADAAPASPALDNEAAGAAAQRLAETLCAGNRFIDLPLYQLTQLDISKEGIGGSVATTWFTSYVLTLDLLEGELADALVAGGSPRSRSLPLRDRYLPDLGSVLGVGGRLCCGGALALCAFARPPGPLRSEADYVVLVQERSSSVINAPGQLAVIPKGFHGPMTDYRNDAKVAATLLREMEEELFGREDIDSTLAGQTAADPLHPARLSEPMRWLMDHPGALRMECTGFGLNLVSGNFEFACLVVVDSDDFWHRFGGDVIANWEASALRQYSSLDAESLAALATDDAWNNEGLFAFMQGLRRLKQIGGQRVNIPEISWEVRP